MTEFHLLKCDAFDIELQRILNNVLNHFIFCVFVGVNDAAVDVATIFEKCEICNASKKMNVDAWNVLF
jgi:hypothetical protein